MILYGDEATFVIVSSFITAVLAANLYEWLSLKRDREILGKSVRLA
jgi:hypothetical protein